MIPAEINPAHMFPRTDATHCRRFFTESNRQDADWDAWLNDAGYLPKHRAEA